MAAIKSKNTKPELIVRSFLFRKGLRFRVHKAALAGKPDLFLKRYKTAIFVHGCFWHQHDRCKNAVVPKSRIKFWATKLSGNVERDKKHIQTLKKNGIKSIVVWECQLWNRSRRMINATFLEKLLNKIKS